MNCILDVSNIVYGGHFGLKDYRISGFPLGGVRKVLGIINSELTNASCALCFDDANILKKELFPTYKAGRVPQYAVAVQIDLLRDICMECNIPILQRETFEADDMICSLVNTLSLLQDDDRINIYSDDHDLACCVSDDVTLMNVTTNGVMINRQNYETRAIRGASVPYNTVLIYKMLYGDKSDNIKGLSEPGLRFDTLAHTFLSDLPSLISEGVFPKTAYMDLRVMNVVIDGLTDSFSEQSRENIRKQAELVFPRLTDITTDGLANFGAAVRDGTKSLEQEIHDQLSIFNLNTIDIDKFTFYCWALGLNKCRPNRYNNSYEDRLVSFKNDLKLRADALSSGVVAVERYRSKKKSGVSESEVLNMSLPI